MADNDSDYEFYVGPATHLEGASLAIDGTARIDGKIVGKVAVKHLMGEEMFGRNSDQNEGDVINVSDELEKYLETYQKAWDESILRPSTNDLDNPGESKVQRMGDKMDAMRREA